MLAGSPAQPEIQQPSDTTTVVIKIPKIKKPIKGIIEKER